MDDVTVKELLDSGELALERLEVDSKRLLSDWWMVGEALKALVEHTLNDTGLNSPNGKAWAKAFGPKLAKQPRLSKVKKGTRSRLMQCMEYRRQIEDWLAEMPRDDSLKLNHPDYVWTRYKREMLENDKDERTQPTKIALQQAANLELQEQLDRIRKTLGVETTEDAVFEVDRLMTDGVVMHGYSDPEVRQHVDDLERQRDKATRELDKATAGLSNTLSELEKNKSQQARQAETITALTERVKQAATILQVFAETVRQYDDPDEEWPDGLPADLERWLAEPTNDHYSDPLKSNSEPAEPPLAEPAPAPPPKKKRGRPPRDRSNDPPPPPKRPRGRPPKVKAAE